MEFVSLHSAVETLSVSAQLLHRIWIINNDVAERVRLMRLGAGLQVPEYWDPEMQASRVQLEIRPG